MPRSLHVAILEPYYGGSHAAFVDALIAGSRHRCTLSTLPARKWKWRMRGAAIWFARDDRSWMTQGGNGPIDLILVSDMLGVSDLRALLPVAMGSVPIVSFFHENQLTYPLPAHEERDFQYGMTNITSCLAADAVAFNSRFHLDDFLTAVTALLAKMPDYVPADVVLDIRRKSTVLSPPVCVDPADRPAGPADKPWTILWCHRWEFDKNPEPFFDALIRLDEAGCGFDLVLAGQQFRTAPPVFEDAWDRLGRHIIHAGYIADRAAYVDLLRRCDLVVSTAIQENFGIAVLEAILAGCQPLLPNRLAYPEIIPPDLHEHCLFPSDDRLYPHLARVLDGPGRLSENARIWLQKSVENRFGARSAVPALDDYLERVANGRGASPIS